MRIAWDAPILRKSSVIGFMILSLALSTWAALPDLKLHAAGIWYVSATSGSGSLCSIAQPCATINQALNVAASGDTIEVAVGVYTASIGSDVVNITQSITLAGGWNAAFTARTGVSTIDGQNVRRGITVSAGPTYIDHFLIMNGRALFGGGMYATVQTLLNDNTFYNNTASGAGATGGALQVGNGQAIAIENSTFYNNTVSGDNQGHGGGIDAGSLTSVNLFNVTISGNTAALGGGIYQEPTSLVTIWNTLVAGNMSTSSAPDDVGGMLVSKGYNLIGVVGPTTLSGGPGDLTGTSSHPLDPHFNSFVNGVLPLRPDSPAVDTGNPNGCIDSILQPLSIDQLGQPRMGRCDIGAYESQFFNATSTFTPTWTATSSQTSTTTQTLTPNTTTSLTPTASPTASATETLTLTPTLNVTPTSTATSTATPQTYPIQTIGIYSPSAQMFYLKYANTSGYADLYIPFGNANSYPIVGKWANPIVDTIGVYDQSNGLFSLRFSNTPGPADVNIVLGFPGDVPMAGRWQVNALYDGVGVFRPSNGLIYLKNELSTGYADNVMVLGIPGDAPVVGDWTHSGKDTPGVYRPSLATFYLSDQVCNCAVYGDHTLILGYPNERAFAGDWLGTGFTGIGVFNPQNVQVYLKNALTTGYADNALAFGMPDGIPFAGTWLLPARPHASGYGALIIANTEPPIPSSIATVRSTPNAGLGDG